MSDVYNSYRTFISSPGDVAAERQFAEEAIQGINRSCLDVLRASIDIKKWENLPPETPNLPEEQIQDLINRDVEKANFFVLILYKRYGSIEPGHTKSNTERELDTILESHKANPSKSILAYFRDIPVNEDPGEQEEQVQKFRRQLEKQGIRYKTYKTPAEFKDIFTHDMYNVLLRITLSPSKKQALEHFWRIGESSRPTHPRLAILSPVVSREFMSTDKGYDVWAHRLMPNIYFEDYKAIHKVRKLLSHIGFHDYKAFFINDPPDDIQFMNRVWICFPRSRVALESLEQYSDILRFQSGLRKGVSSGLKWMSSSGKSMTVKSPLTKYLEEQRKSMDRSGEWHGLLNKIYCKDFAIIARFKNIKSKEFTDEGYLYDYYIAGIRGLGTWGAAWFIDRKSKCLLDYSKDEDIQSLLEITYRNGAIVDVIDVSNKPEEYFKEQVRTGYIRKQINTYRDR